MSEENTTLRRWWLYLIESTCKLLAPLVAFSLYALGAVIGLGAVACAALGVFRVVLWMWGLLF
ncbi:MAG: hypothetical protein GF393_05255 [Armatimonadia bacterium]|nr:hypothetical protein [Armatimonadia bacterium]